MNRKVKVTTLEQKIFAFLTLFGFTSIVLKLFDVIDWSWALVTLPFWIFFFFVVVVLSFAIVMGIIVHCVKVLAK